MGLDQAPNQLVMPKFPLDQKGPPSPDFVLHTYSLLCTTFAMRNAEYQVLRKVFDGDFVGAQAAKAIGDAQFSERIKLIYNICNATVRRYMDQLSAPPRIEAVPKSWTDEDLERADKQTKFLEYVYEQNNFNVRLMQAGFYQSLLDNAVWHTRPNPNGKCKIKLELGIPDFYYPVVSSDDWNEVRGVIYAFRKFNPGAWQQNPMRPPVDGTLGQNTDVVVEWWDNKYFMRFENGKLIATIQHDLGEIPWRKADNIPIPHRFRGQGDVDQAIGLNEYLNMLMSDMADMINYAANPIAVVRGTKVGGVNLPFAPRAVWELERDAQVGFLQWSGAPPSVEAQLIRSIQAIEDTTGVSSPAFGREIPSGTSGSAVRSLMAGFNTRLGTKQTLMGGALVGANYDICNMAEKLFPNWEVPVVGIAQQGKFRGKQIDYVVKPKDFNGWYKTRLIFPPADPTTAYFQEMDKMAKAVQSRETTMRNVGITDIHDELQRIKAENLEAAAHANNMGLAQQGKFISPDQQAQAAGADSQGLQDVISKIQSLPGVRDDGSLAKRAKKKAEDDALKQNALGLTSEASKPSGPEGASETPGTTPINMADVIQALRRAAGLSGRGAITPGKDGQSFTISLENPQDAAAIKLALGAAASKATFTLHDFKKPLPEDSINFTDPSKKGMKPPKEPSEPPDEIGVTNPIEKSVSGKESKKKSIQRSGIQTPGTTGGLDENDYPIDQPTP